MIKYLKQYADKTFEELVNSLIWFDNPLKLKAIFAKLYTTLLADAPIDGKLYGRQDEEWTEIINEVGIPLSGTAVGNPVTGDIEFASAISRKIISEACAYIEFVDDGTLNINKEAGSNVNVAGIDIFGGGIGEFGIRGLYDYSSNITDLDYTQKIYVDGMRGKHISKTTTEINAIITPQDGETYFNTTLNKLCFFNGTIWQQVTSSVM